MISPYGNSCLCSHSGGGDGGSDGGAGSGGAGGAGSGAGGAGNVSMSAYAIVNIVGIPSAVFMRIGHTSLTAVHTICLSV